METRQYVHIISYSPFPAEHFGEYVLEDGRCLIIETESGKRVFNLTNKDKVQFIVTKVSKA